MIEKFRDKISTSDSVTESKGKSLFRTRITFKDYEGKDLVSVTSGEHNMTILPGRLEVLEKLFGISPDKSQRKFLSDMIPDPQYASTGSSTSDEFLSMDSDSTYKALHAKNTIIGTSKTGTANFFCIGNGGEVPNTNFSILTVHDWETRLYNMVPFRCVPVNNDLTTEERANYRLRKEITIEGSNYYAYYLKKFKVEKVYSKKSNANYEPATEDSDPYIAAKSSTHTMSGHTSSVYITITFDIAKEEFKEYYRLLHNDSLSGARLTELGIVSALDVETSTGINEVFDPELITKLVHDPAFLSSEQSYRTVVYEILA